MSKSVLHVELDVHKMSMDVTLAEPGAAGEIRYYGRIGGDLDCLDGVIRKLESKGAKLLFEGDQTSLKCPASLGPENHLAA